jgi:hypothetical protein
MSSSSNGGKKPASGGRGGPTIRTLSDINRGTAGFPGAEGGGSDSDEPQEYYTGGEKRYLTPFLSAPRPPSGRPYVWDFLPIVRAGIGIAAAAGVVT